MKILICDDDISTVSVLEHQIDWEKKGIDKVLTAYNGKAAIEIVKEEGDRGPEIHSSEWDPVRVFVPDKL